MVFAERAALIERALLFEGGPFSQMPGFLGGFWMPSEQIWVFRHLRHQQKRRSSLFFGCDSHASGGQACRSLLCQKHCGWLRRCQETAERRELEELRHRAEAVEEQEKKEEELFGNERKDVFFCLNDG